MTLQNVTVIIPAHNRPERLRRLLDYYSRTDIKVLVPDSSDHPFADAEKYPDITYLHRPKLHFLLKLKEVLPMISTPYVLYCADDDFAVPSGIAQMTAFLDEHPDYSTAQGHYLTFTPHKGKISFYPRYIRYFDKQVTGDTPRERLLQEKNMYASSGHKLFRGCMQLVSTRTEACVSAIFSWLKSSLTMLRLSSANMLHYPISTVPASVSEVPPRKLPYLFQLSKPLINIGRNIKVSFWRYQNYWQPGKVIRLKMLSPLFVASAICLKTLPKSLAKGRLWNSLISIPCYVG